MKTCYQCHETRPFTEFHPKKTRKDGLQSRCKRCTATYQREQYRKNKDRYSQLATLRTKRCRQYVFDYLKIHPCIKCGEADPILLEFDHLHSKLMGVSSLVKYGLPSIQREIAKCQVLCVRCHRFKTAKEQNWYKDLI